MEGARQSGLRQRSLRSNLGIWSTPRCHFRERSSLCQQACFESGRWDFLLRGVTSSSSAPHIELKSRLQQTCTISRKESMQSHRT